MASSVPLKDPNKSLDLYEAVKITLQGFSLTFANLSGISTDDASAMKSKKKKETYKINTRQCSCHQQLMFDEISLHLTSRECACKSFKNG